MKRVLPCLVFVVAACGAEPDVIVLQVPPPVGQGDGDGGEIPTPEPDSGLPAEDDAGQGVEDGYDAGTPAEDSGAPDEGDDAGGIVVGPGPDAGSEPVPYFERSCPSACPSVPDPEKPDVVVEDDMCYSGPEGKSCTFFCVEYIPAEDHWVGDVPAQRLCADLGGTCVYLDAMGHPVPGDQELANESSYCLPPGAPTRP